MDQEGETRKRNESLSQLVETFRCCVCLGFLRPGQKLRCCTPNGHLICNSCYASMKKIKKAGDGSQLSCPICRVGKFDEAANFAALKALFDIAKNFIVYDCQGVNWGCTAKLSANDVLGHEAVCGSALSICPGSGCNFKAPYKHLAEHNWKREGTPCFTFLRTARNGRSFFVWIFEVGGRELLDDDAGAFRPPYRGFKPGMLCSQDPSVKACLLTGITEDKQFFAASVVWLQDNFIPKTRREKRFVKIVAQSCSCKGQKFTGEAAFQNWDKNEMEAEGRQLKIHRSTFQSFLGKCLVCNSENSKVVLQIEVLFRLN